MSSDLNTLLTPSNVPLPGFMTGSSSHTHGEIPSSGGERAVSLNPNASSFHPTVYQRWLTYYANLLRHDGLYIMYINGRLYVSHDPSQMTWITYEDVTSSQVIHTLDQFHM